MEYFSFIHCCVICAGMLFFGLILHTALNYFCPPKCVQCKQTQTAVNFWDVVENQRGRRNMTTVTEEEEDAIDEDL